MGEAASGGGAATAARTVCGLPQESLAVFVVLGEVGGVDGERAVQLSAALDGDGGEGAVGGEAFGGPKRGDVIPAKANEPADFGFQMLDSGLFERRVLNSEIRRRDWAARRSTIQHLTSEMEMLRMTVCEAAL